MTLVLTEEHVHRLAPMSDAIAALEESLRRQGEGAAVNLPRRRLLLSQGALQLLPAGDPGRGVLGMKVYSGSPRGGRVHVYLYSSETGDLLAIIQAQRLGQIRTGAASGVATRFLARQESSVLGIIGTGYQAQTQVEAVCAVRPVKRVLVYGRNPERRQAFAAQARERLGVTAVAVGTGEEAVAEADVVVTMTNAATPVLKGEWLRPGMHVNAAGSNSLLRRELDLAAVERADRIVVDDREQAALESGDLLEPAQRGIVQWSHLAELGDVVAGTAAGRRSPQEITLFESHGVGLWDVALAGLVYRRAKEEKVGQEVSL
ncbi:MAG: ornithine cyclodeaminase family protein [Chloroflexi bacterium]|nr:ornithine cyclodeaminase family protein [Chloroflexota bacterium]